MVTSHVLTLVSAIVGFDDVVVSYAANGTVITADNAGNYTVMDSTTVKVEFPQCVHVSQVCYKLEKLTLAPSTMTDAPFIVFAMGTSVHTVTATWSSQSLAELPSVCSACGDSHIIPTFNGYLCGSCGFDGSSDYHPEQVQ